MHNFAHSKNGLLSWLTKVRFLQSVARVVETVLHNDVYICEYIALRESSCLHRRPYHW